MATDMAFPRKNGEGTKPEGEHVEKQPDRSPGAKAPYDGPESDKKVLREKDAYKYLGYGYPTWKKWFILTIMFLIQISINLNASVSAQSISGPLLRNFSDLTPP